MFREGEDVAESCDTVDIILRRIVSTSTVADDIFNFSRYYRTIIPASHFFALQNTHK